MGSVDSRWSKTAVTIALAVLSASISISVCFWRRKSRELSSKIKELEASLADSLKNCAAERQGRIRAQQAFRKAIAEAKSDNVEFTSYPMTPIGIVHSPFSTRNGTPRQPLLVPLARATLVFNTSRVPPASLEGLGDYSHCWIIYVFHLNTNLEKLWRSPSNSKFKAKVRVPRLNGGKMGVFATRSPHRSCPIGLSVAKVEAVQGHKILLSGVDLVDGTPVLDIKPYLPSDSINGATVPTWLMEDNILTVASVGFSESFSSALADCWAIVGKKSLYETPEEFKSFIKEVLSWDIRSVSQRNRPQNAITNTGNDYNSDSDGYEGNGDSGNPHLSSGGIIYHVFIEGLNVSYKINHNGNVVVVQNIELPSSNS